MSERLPEPDLARFPPLTDDEHWLRSLPTGTLLGRIFRAGGEHPCAWHELREYGPLDARYDPHPPPTDTHPGFGVLYAAVEQSAMPRSKAPADTTTADSTTPEATTSDTAQADTAASAFAACVLEVFQQGIIDRHTGEATFAAFEIARPLRLLDLSDSDWLTVAGGNAAILSGERSRARQWARAIRERYPDIDGVWAASSVVPSARIAALWQPAASAIPTHPLSLIPLARPEITGVLEVIAARYGCTLI